MKKRIRVELPGMLLPDGLDKRNGIDWGTYEAKRKAKTSKGTGRPARRIKAVATGNGVGSLDSDRNESIAGAERG